MRNPRYRQAGRRITGKIESKTKTMKAQHETAIEGLRRQIVKQGEKNVENAKHLLIAVITTLAAGLVIFGNLSG